MNDTSIATSSIMLKRSVINNLKKKKVSDLTITYLNVKY